MSTRAMIGMRMPDGGVRAVYCHHDGYPTGVGAILGGWYKTPEQVESLLTLGDLSALGTNLVIDTIAYHRDQGEAFTPPRRYRNVNGYQKTRCILGADYLYLYDNGRWLLYGITSEDWIELKVTMKAKNENV